MLWTLTYDADGHPGPGSVPNLITNIRESGIRDLVVFSHGWNNGAQQATSLYERWFELLRPHLDDAAKVGFVGLYWPSQLWRDEPIPDFEPPTVDGGGSAGVVTTSSAAVLTSELDPDILADLKDLFPERASNLDAVAGLLAVPVTQESIAALYREIEAFSRIEPDLDDGESGSAPTLPGMFTDHRTPTETFEYLADTITATGVIIDAPDVGAAGLRDVGAKILAGAKETLRQASYWRMKQRAGTVGSVGLGPTLNQLGSEFPELRIHLVGHSFGGRVVSFALPPLPGGQASPVKFRHPVAGGVLPVCVHRPASFPFGRRGTCRDAEPGRRSDLGVLFDTRSCAGYVLSDREHAGRHRCRCRRRDRPARTMAGDGIARSARRGAGTARSGRDDLPVRARRHLELRRLRICGSRELTLGGSQ